MAFNKPIRADEPLEPAPPPVPVTSMPLPGLTPEQLAGLNTGTTPTPPDVAPTSEMGMWINEMIRQGILTRGAPVPTSSSGSPAAAGTVADAATGGPGGTDVVGTEATTPDPSQPPEGWVRDDHNRWVNPGVTTTMAPEDFQAVMAELAANNYQIPEGSPLYARRNEILREIRRYDPNATFENREIGGGGEGGGQGLRALQMSFDPRRLTGTPTTVNTPALRSLLEAGLYNAGGGGDLMSEMYNAWDGENILRQLQQYDPNAHWEDTPYSGTSSGGEGGLSNVGRRLVYDRNLLPVSEAEKHGWDLAPVHDDTRMVNPAMTYYDPIYGRVTDKRNIKQDPATWWEVAAPIAISMLAPYAAPALFGAMGVAPAAAGFTSAVTSGAAGLSAANTAGSFAAGAGPLASGAGPRPTTVTGGVRTAGGLADTLTQQPYRPTAPAAGRAPTVPVRGATPAATTTPSTTVTTTPYTPDAYGGGTRPVGTAGTPTTAPNPTTTTRLARNQVAADPYGAQGVTTPKTSRYADTYGFDPSAFNSGGSTTKPASTNSKLVATQFADDPYRFS